MARIPVTAQPAAAGHSDLPALKEGGGFLPRAPTISPSDVFSPGVEATPHRTAWTDRASPIPIRILRLTVKPQSHIADGAGESKK
jgi:hypothetical protein